MTAQQTLDGTPGPGGLWAKVIHDSAIDHPAWLRACADSSFVGNCRTCGDYLIPRRPEQHSRRTDYAAVCRAEGCRYEINAPAGRVMRGSTKKSDQPKTGK